MEFTTLVTKSDRTKRILDVSKLAATRSHGFEWLNCQCDRASMVIHNQQLSVEMVGLDERTGNVILLTGEEILIEIYPNANWRFVNEI